MLQRTQKKQKSLNHAAIKEAMRDIAAEEAGGDKAGEHTITVSREAMKALAGGNTNAIVDIRLTTNDKQEAAVSRQEYAQLFQEGYNPKKQGSTFGNKTSMWVWRRGKGTCSGRLKPIVDLIVHNQGTSTELVLGGYTCNSPVVGGLYLWVRRAVTEEEEKDAIIDISFTTGMMKRSNDPIWTSPGVGWVRVDGNLTKSTTWCGGLDTFMWILPARSRSSEAQYISPLRSKAAVTDEVKYAKVLSMTRLSIRHYIHVDDMKRLSTALMGGSSGNTSSALQSERLKDFSAMFHKIGAKEGLNIGKFSALLNEVGIRVGKVEELMLFNLFDTSQNGLITIEEFTGMLSLTNYEIDLTLEKIRLQLLRECAEREGAQFYEDLQVPQLRKLQSPNSAAKANAGVLGTSSNMTLKLGRCRIKECSTLSHVFLLINTKDDGILSLSEMMDLCSKLEVFVTEEEARRMLLLMDVDHNDRVEEMDFIAFLQQSSQAATRKAFRVREAATTLRRWLQRGATTGDGGDGGASRASSAHWEIMKRKQERMSKEKFPGFLVPQVLMVVMPNLGYRLSPLEARELTFMISPDKNGRIYQAELHAFMGREHRSYGELLALIERDLLSTLIDPYRVSYEEEERTGREDADLVEKYKKVANAIVKEIEKVYHQPSGGGDGGPDTAPAPMRRSKSIMTSGAVELISVGQLKDGMQNYFKKTKYARDVPEKQLPNLEEWASICVLVQGAVTEGDIYGVRLRAFIDNLSCLVVQKAEEIRLKQGEKYAVERVAKELQRQIRLEAQRRGNGKKPDYKYVFHLFDEDRGGSISVQEMRDQLRRFQLLTHLPDHQLDSLMAMFVQGKRQEIELKDFIAFAERGQQPLAEVDVVEGDVDDDDLDYDEMLNSDDPPVALTQNDACDRLLWYLYRQAHAVNEVEPESVINDLQRRCGNVEVTMNSTPFITIEQLWHNVQVVDMVGDQLEIQRFIAGVQKLCLDDSITEKDRVDFELFCRYIVRMGRAFNAKVQEMQREDERKFITLFEDLQRFFKTMADEKPEEGSTSDLRFEKLFKRMDNNRDGMINTREFKNGLIALRYRDAKLWTRRLIRFLFNICDRNRDGLLSIKEFTAFILSSKGQLKLPYQQQEYTDEGLSDDEDDFIFRKGRNMEEHNLLHKVTDLLMEVLPREEGRPGTHMEQIRNSVRRFFQRADVTHRGVVSEERFRAFLRRSGLQNGLTASEMRILTKKLSKVLRHGEIVVEYERLVQQLTNVGNHRTRSEAVLIRLHDAAKSSAAMGRSFLSLCSLLDLHLTGHITKNELQHTCKMMDCVLTDEDIDALCQLLPASAFSSDGKSVDYRLVEQLLEGFENEEQKKAETESSSAAMSLQDLNPHSPRLVSPRAVPEKALSMNVRGSIERNGTAWYELVFSALAQRIMQVLVEKNQRWGAPISLRHQFTAIDIRNTGLVNSRALQGVFDEMGVQLTSADLQAVFILYGKPEDDVVFYDALCSAISQQQQQQQPEVMKSQQPDRGVSLTVQLPAETERLYLHSRVIARLKQLKEGGIDIYEFFDYYDSERNGTIRTSRFIDVLSNLQLLHTEHQVQEAIEDFHCVSNKSVVNYQDFLRALERAARKAVPQSPPPSPPRVIRSRRSYDFGDDNSTAGGYSLMGSHDPPTVPLSPPKLSESLPTERFHHHTVTSSYTPPKKFWSIDDPPRSPIRSSLPPGKVGSKMWGSHTPLKKKGRAPLLTDGKWCCKVCMYIDNEETSRKCAVCDCPRSKDDVDSHIRNECFNCTFRNQRFADECEMCGVKLGSPSND